MKKNGMIAGAFLLLVFLGFAYYRFASNGSKESVSNPEQKFNVVMIVSDALRQDVLGCYGGDASTPNIDRLAGLGVLFENAYTACPWTAPASVSMFTGNHATSYSCSPQRDSRRPLPTTIYVPRDESLLAEFLPQHGYHTGRMIENPNASIHNNFQGFAPIQKPKFTNQLADSIHLITGNRPIKSTASIQASIFLGYLLNQRPGELFFALHWILDPHYPYEPAAKFESRIDVDEARLSKPKKFYEKGVRNPNRLSEIEKRYYRNLYIAEVESVDERIGSVLKVLEFKNLLASTYIIFTSDHGEQFGQHGLYGHGGLGRGCHYYEGLMRIPLIIAGPGLPGGRRVKANVSNLDLMPTLKDLLRIEYDDNMQGKSFASVLRGADNRGRPVYFDDVKKHQQIDALVDDQYKLITLTDGTFELYDKSNDPEELDNLADQLPELVETMFEMIKIIRKENEGRRAYNITTLGDNIEQPSEEERKRLIKKLKSLGYVQ